MHRFAVCVWHFGILGSVPTWYPCTIFILHSLLSLCHIDDVFWAAWHMLHVQYGGLDLGIDLFCVVGILSFRVVFLHLNWFFVFHFNATFVLIKK